MIVFEWEREREESKEGNVNTFVRSCCEDLLQLLCDRTMKPIFILNLLAVLRGVGLGRGEKKKAIVHWWKRGERNSDRRWWMGFWIFCEFFFKNPDTPKFQGKKIGSVSWEALLTKIINLIKELQNHAFFFCSPPPPPPLTFIQTRSHNNCCWDQLKYGSVFFFSFLFLGSHIIRPFFLGICILGNPVLCPTNLFWGGGPKWFVIFRGL